MGQQIRDPNSRVTTYVIMGLTLVTGATGFVGNYVVRELLKAGENVIATSADQSKAETKDWFDKVSYVQLDFSNLNKGLNYFEYFDNPDRVIHLAWERLPNYKSLFHFEENLERHYLFLKNLVQNGCRDVTVTGTCFEYGMVTGCLEETVPTEPANPYALAKDTLNKFLIELSKTERFSLKWVRLFYLYGKGQNPGSLFSQLEKALNENAATFNMSGGEQVRDFLPVEKAAEYIVKIALQNKVTGTINCCSGEPVSVKDFVSGYVHKRGKQISLNLGYYPYADYEPMSFWGDNKKLQQIINEK
jgi:nucleoside-diphosphate-sugar epimerase